MPSTTTTLGAGELRDLRRVFDHLACHVERTLLNRNLLAKNDRYARLQNFIENPQAASPVQNAEGADIRCGRNHIYI